MNCAKPLASAAPRSYRCCERLPRPYGLRGTRAPHFASVAEDFTHLASDLCRAPAHESEYFKHAAHDFAKACAVRTGHGFEDHGSVAEAFGNFTSNKHTKHNFTK